MTVARRRAIQPASFPIHDMERLTFSPGLEVDGTLWLSGSTAARVDPVSQRSTVEGDLVEQMRTIYEKLGAVVEAAGLRLSDVVRTVDYVTPEGRKDYLGTQSLRRAVFGPRPPATCTVVVDGLLRPGALIEIEALATRDVSVDIGLNQPSENPSVLMRNAGNNIYLSTLGAPESKSNEPSGVSTVLRQTREIYAYARRALADRGMSLDHVVRVVEFLTPEALARYAEVRHVREASLSRRVATTTIVMAQSMKLESLVQIEFVAAVDRGSIATGDDQYGGSDRAAALRVGHLVFASGQRALNRATGKMQYVGDVVSQTRAAYDNLAHALEAVGASARSVVHTTEFVTRAGLADYRNTASVRREVFNRPFPTATGIVCKGLLDSDALVELEATAYLDSGAR